jgi:outer membrane lipopolysaccharide assembly protein LptE/RlpB
MSNLRIAGLAAVAMLAAGCGYHVAGKGDLLPKNLKTIAIPAFINGTTRYRLADKIPAALTREFIMRTKYQIITDQSQADAVLSGSVNRFDAFPVVFNQATGRATTVEVHMTLQITLRERASGKVLFQRPNVEFRDRYEISVDPNQYFEESEPATDRLCRDVAQTVVSAVLENF